MKRLKRSYIKNLILPAVLIATIFTNVCAADELLYSQDYSGITTAPGTTISNGGYVVAEVKDGALVMQSDAMCFWKAPASYEDTEAGQKAAFTALHETAHGIALLDSQAYGEPFEDGMPEDYTGTKTYDYSGDITDTDNALIARKKAGLNGIGTVNYYHTGENKALGTNVRFAVDQDLAENLGSNVTFKIKLYADADGGDAWLYYGSSGQIKLNTGVAEEDRSGNGVVGGRWIESVIEVTNADLTGVKDSAYGNNIRISKLNASKGIFIHSIEIYKTPTDDSAEVNASYIETISDSALSVNATVNFDLNIPTQENMGSAYYNTEGSVMYTSILDDEKTEGSKLKYVVGSEGALSVYACTSTDEVLVSNELALGTTYTYTIKSYANADKFDVEIKETSTSTTKASQVDLDGAGAIQYVGFSQLIAENGVKAIVDNINVSWEISQDYLDCEAALEELTLTLEPEDTLEAVTKDFALTTTGANDTTIEWASDHPAIVIDGNNGIAIVERYPDKQEVKITAIVKKGDAEVTKDFYVTVKGLGEVFVKVNSSASISNGTVTGSATISSPGATGAQSVTFAVFAIDPTTGRITAKNSETQAVSNPHDVISFANVTASGADSDDIAVSYVWDENGRPLTNNAPTIENFKASNKASGVVITWDAYDDYDAAEEFDIYRGSEKIATIGKEGDHFLPAATEGDYANTITYRKIDGAWKVVSGAESAKVSANSYKFIDQAAKEGVEYNYSIVSRDTNQNECEKIEKDENNEFFTAKKIAMPYYNSPGATKGELDSNSNGINMMYADNTAAEVYSTYFDNMTDNGVSVSGRWIENGTRTNGRNMAFKLSDVAANDSVVVRYRIYLDKAATVKVCYNAVGGFNANGPSLDIKEGNGVLSPGKWIYVNVILEDTNFGGYAGKFSNGHFGFTAPNNPSKPAKIYLYRVEAAKLTDWE